MFQQLKRLGTETAIYGISTILGRFLNFLLVPFYTNVLAPGDYGIVAYEYSLIAFKFPMSVGAAWSYTAKSGQTGQLERRANYKVVAFEPVTVPAGTFDCFHVEGEWQTNGLYYHSRGTDIYWYCPKINFIAKRQSEFEAQPRGQPASREWRLSELTNFTPGK